MTHEHNGRRTPQNTHGSGSGEITRLSRKIFLRHLNLLGCLREPVLFNTRLGVTARSEDKMLTVLAPDLLDESDQFEDPFGFADLSFLRRCVRERLVVRPRTKKTKDLLIAQEDACLLFHEWNEHVGHAARSLPTVPPESVNSALDPDDTREWVSTLSQGEPFGVVAGFFKRFCKIRPLLSWEAKANYSAEFVLAPDGGAVRLGHGPQNHHFFLPLPELRASKRASVYFGREIENVFRVLSPTATLSLVPDGPLIARDDDYTFVLQPRSE